MRDSHISSHTAGILGHLQVDVASHAPGGGPTVAYNPIGLGRSGVVAHRHDAMVLEHQTYLDEKGTERMSDVK